MSCQDTCLIHVEGILLVPNLVSDFIIDFGMVEHGNFY